MSEEKMTVEEAAQYILAQVYPTQREIPYVKLDRPYSEIVLETLQAQRDAATQQAQSEISSLKNQVGVLITLLEKNLDCCRGTLAPGYTCRILRAERYSNAPLCNPCQAREALSSLPQSAQEHAERLRAEGAEQLLTDLIKSLPEYFPPEQAESFSEFLKTLGPSTNKDRGD